MIIELVVLFLFGLLVTGVAMLGVYQERENQRIRRVDLDTGRILSERSWSDLELRAVAWDEHGRDLVLEFLPPATEAQEAPWTVRGRWASNLRVSLALGEKTGGYPLTWDLTGEKRADGQWEICVDFGGAGDIRFTCNELDVS